MKFLLQLLPAWLDKTGMYRVVTMALIALVTCAIITSALGQIFFKPQELLFSLFVALAAALVLNMLFAKLWRISVNHESAIITALILFFLILPGAEFTWADQKFIFLATSVAIASKYLLVWRKQHLVNPVAAGASLLGLWFVLVPGESYFEALWWVGTPVLFVPLITVGFLVVHKVRKEAMVLSFLGAAFVAYLFESWRFGSDLVTDARFFWLSGPSLFLAVFMLTEPFTSPPTKRLQIMYGTTVGLISQLTLFSAIIPITPELALIVGNLLFWPTRLQQKLFLIFKRKQLIAQNTWEYVFAKPAGFTFKAGQYLEWMLPHQAPDSRGIRRYFTIASSPTESEVRLVFKLVSPGSTYKQRLSELDTGEVIIGSQLAGDFLLPKNVSQKLGFIAGGIGVTPFRSHLQFLVDADRQSDVVLYYCNVGVKDIAYGKEFSQIAQTIPLEVINVIAADKVEAPFEQGFVTAEMLKRRTPDYLERHWYLSGPPGMVNAYTKLLREIGVLNKHITKDFFPGLA